VQANFFTKAGKIKKYRYQYGFHTGGPVLGFNVFRSAMRLHTCKQTAKWQQNK
jgi:hypothetical protein